MKNTKTQGYERLAGFFDAGTFVELCAYVARPGSEDAEGVVCGYGARDGRLVFAFAQDSTRMKGALDARHADKIVAVYQKALAVGAPIVGMFDCAGAVVFEGASALAAYGKLLACTAAARAKVPQLAVICGSCAGTMAAVAANFDMVITAGDAAKLYVSSPSLVGEEIGTAAYLAKNATAALSAATEQEALALVGELLSYLPDRSGARAPESVTDDLNRMLSLPAGVDAKGALSAAVDAGRFLQLYKEASACVCAGLANMGGIACVALAIDGVLDLAAVRVMQRVQTLAAEQGLPVVSFVNCQGLAASAADEPEMATALAALSRVLCAERSPRITVIVGDAIGAGFLFGGAKTLHADLVLALPEARISVLTPAAGVAFLWNDRITPDCTREQLEQEWRDAAAPEAAAAVGEVDDIIAPTELRARILAGLMMLRDKRCTL